MAKPQPYQPPRRKEPSLIGQLFSALVQLFVWLMISLMLSIVIEWIGMIWFWPDQGSNHAKRVLAEDQRYLSEQFQAQSLALKKDVVVITREAVNWMASQVLA